MAGTPRLRGEEETMQREVNIESKDGDESDGDRQGGEREGEKPKIENRTTTATPFIFPYLYFFYSFLFLSRLFIVCPHYLSGSKEEKQGHFRRLSPFASSSSSAISSGSSSYFHTSALLSHAREGIRHGVPSRTVESLRKCVRELRG